MTNISNIIASGTIPSAGLIVNINNDNIVNITSKNPNIQSCSNKISFINIFESISAIYDYNSKKVIIVYRDDNNKNYGKAIVGTVNGDSIIFGAPVIFNNGITEYISTNYDPVNQKVIIAYSDTNNSWYGTVIIGTIIGDSIKFDTPIIFNTNYTNDISAIYDSINNKIIIAYHNVSNSEYGTVIVGYINGTNITFGTPVVFNNSITLYTSASYDPVNQKVIIAYSDYDNKGYGTVIVGDINGTNILFGTPVVFNNNDTWHISTVYDTINDKIIIAYCDCNNSEYGTAVVGNVNGTSITFVNKIVLNNSNTWRIFTIYDLVNSKVIRAYYDISKPDYSKSVIKIIN